MKVFFTSLLIAALIGSSSLAETTCSQPDDVERLKCYDDASGYGRNYQQKLEDFKRNGYDIHYCVAALQVFYKGSPKLIAYEGMYGPIFEDTVLALSTLIGEMHSFQASELKKFAPEDVERAAEETLDIGQDSWNRGDLEAGRAKATDLKPIIEKCLSVAESCR